MGFSSYTTIITYLVAAVGIAAICLVDTVGNGFIAVMIAVMAASLVVSTRTSLVVPKALWNVLAIVVFTLFLVDYLTVSGTLIGASARFLTILVALKLFDLKTTRDYVLFFTLVLFQILAAAASTVSPIFFLILSLFIICSIWAMIIFSMKRDWEEANPEVQSMPRAVFGTPFFLGTIALTASSILITLMLFFLIPRMAVGFFEAKTLNTIKVTGFSDRIDLGDIGPVKQDPTVVMRVEIPEIPKSLPILYFRGATLDRYDGTGWNKTIKKIVPAKKIRDGLFVVGDWERGLVEQKILLEPLDTDILFAASRGVSVSGRFARVMTDGAGSIYLPSPPYSRLEYKAWSNIDGSPKFDDIEVTRGGSPYLQIPEEGGRVGALAFEISKGKPTDWERAKAINDYLKQNHLYTLNPKKGAGATPLEDFLFFSKEGYCEHYATAMVMLLRHLGIPSRIVTGFLQGQWNTYGNYFLVRQQDAHSWVEAYIPGRGGRGWTTFDPTPSQGLATPVEASWLGLFVDSLRWRWARHIVNYTLSDQIRMARKMESRLGSIQHSLRRSLSSFFTGGPGGRWAWWVLAIPVVVIVLLKTIISKGILSGKKISRKTPEFYLEMLSILKRRGFERRPFETPMEFAARTGHTVAKSITTTFEVVRYGGRTLTETEMSGVKSSMEVLKRGVG
jgi:hypothetical protein